MTARPYVHWSTAEIQAELRRLAPYVTEYRRRQKASEDEARLRRLESVVAGLQQDMPAGALNNDRLKKKVGRLSGRVSSVATTADVAASRAFALTRELQTEVAERKADRDRIQQRVTGLEIQSIDRSRQNPR